MHLSIEAITLWEEKKLRFQPNNYVPIPNIQGNLSDGTIIAAKQLSSKSRQGNREFLNELGMISALQHPCLVKLYGCCVEGDQLLLVYEYMGKNSLARALFGNSFFHMWLAAFSCHFYDILHLLTNIHGNTKILCNFHFFTNDGPAEYHIKLDWPTRQKICVGIARGLTYLHEESRLKIVHRGTSRPLMCCLIKI